MYEYIDGKIAELTPATVVVDCGGVGYIFNISLQSYEELENKESVRMYVHQYMVRDELPVFYGFTTKKERELFRLLVGVSGVGGGTARMVLSTYTTAELGGIISSGNVAMLKKVKGLGTKTAEKIIVELRDKTLSFGAKEDAALVESLPTPEDMQTVSEALKALVMLGFNKTAAEKVIKQIASESPHVKVEDMIRLALKRL